VLIEFTIIKFCRNIFIILPDWAIMIHLVGINNISMIPLLGEAINAMSLCNIPWLRLHGLLWDLPGTVDIVLSCFSSVQ
jgi:hypothetical protein